MAPSFTALVMAAGRGTRMRSSLPKVLHPVCGRPMVEWVIDAARDAGATRIVCITRPGDGVAGGLPAGVEVAEQVEGEGTGSAVLAAREAVPQGQVVVLSGDVPLIDPGLIARLVEALGEGAAALLSTRELDPAGYGRVVRGPEGEVERIVETKHPEDATAEELAIDEVNMGTYAFDAEALWAALDAVGEERGERYLPSALPVLRDRGHGIAAHETSDLLSATGVNSRADLMRVDALAQRRLLDAHAEAGVTFLAPESIRVEAGVRIGEDTVVWPATVLRGDTQIGPGCEIGPSTTITDSRLEAGVRASHSVLVEAEVAERATLGPFAYLRPGARIGAGAKVGTYVEVKNSDIGAHSKVPHLSYIGDADVGEQTNLGAGNVTANYDGREKHRTTIGAGVRTGVDTTFVAPVRVGDGAYTGAGSVIVEDVPAGALAIARSKQTVVEGYAARRRKENPSG